MSARTQFWVIVFVVIAVLLLHAILYLPFLTDDAFISLRYAERFLEGKGLTWNDGEYVEGYSNLLWVLVTSFLGKFHLDLVVAIRLLGFIGMSLAIIAVIWRYRPSLTKSWLVPSIPAMFLALSATFAGWVVGGLEQPFQAALLAWAVAFSYPLFTEEKYKTSQILLIGLLLGLLAITRPDGMLFSVAIVIALLLSRGFNKNSLRISFLLLLLPVLFYLGQLGFRIYYYGEFFPNTAFVKIPTSPRRILTGAGYLLRGFIAYALFLIPAAWGGVQLYKNPKKRPLVILLTVPLFFWSFYVMLISGDIFPAYRHFVPILVLSAFLLGLWLEEFLPAHPNLSKKRGAWIAGVILTLFFIVQITYPHNRSEAIKGAGIFVWDGEVVGNLLKAGFKGKEPLLAVDAAGSVSYYTGFPTIDMLGLNDYHIARAAKPKTGKEWYAHDRGDGAYVLSRKPDLIIMGWPGGGVQDAFPGDAQLLADKSLHENYTLVNFEGEVPYTFRSQIWVKKNEGVVGLQREGAYVSIPGYLFAGNRPNLVKLIDGKLGAFVDFNTPLQFDALKLSEGKWMIKIDEVEETLHITLRDKTTNREIPVNQSMIQIDHPTEIVVDINQPVEGKKGYLYRVVFEKK